MSIKDTKDFIEKAIEGGYKTCCLPSQIPEVTDCGIYCNGGWVAVENLLLSPEIWQAVGRVEGWEGTTYDGSYTKEDGEFIAIKSDVWHVKMNGLTPALIEGKTIDEYLKTL